MKLNNIHSEIEAFLGYGELDFFKIKEDAISLVYKVKPRQKSLQNHAIIMKCDLEESGALINEAKSLSYLSANTNLPVPQVHKGNKKFLAMNFLIGKSGLDENKRAEIDMAFHLSNLHHHSAPFFGFEFPTSLGGITQVNTKSERWIPFFGEHRLLDIAELAITKKGISLEIVKRLEHLTMKLGELLSEPEKANLIHGDIWSGNILASDGKIVGFIDPAISFSHRELELAFISLFNTAGRDFWLAYNERYPIEKGFWETRCAIYQLHPLLVHSTLFGGHYIESVSFRLKQIGF